MSHDHYIDAICRDAACIDVADVNDLHAYVQQIKDLHDDVHRMLHVTLPTLHDTAECYFERHLQLPLLGQSDNATTTTTPKDVTSFMHGADTLLLQCTQLQAKQTAQKRRKNVDNHKPMTKTSYAVGYMPTATKLACRYQRSKHEKQKYEDDTAHRARHHQHATAAATIEKHNAQHGTNTTITTTTTDKNNTHAFNTATQNRHTEPQPGKNNKHNNIPTTAQPFGAAAAAPSTTGDGKATGFGAAAQPFGAAAVPSTTGDGKATGFGAAAQPFGAAAAAPSTTGDGKATGFGAAAQPFGAAAAAPSTTGDGKATGFGAAAQPFSSVFRSVSTLPASVNGGSVVPVASVFGNAANATSASSFRSRGDDFGSGAAAQSVFGVPSSSSQSGFGSEAQVPHASAFASASGASAQSVPAPFAGASSTRQLFQPSSFSSLAGNFVQGTQTQFKSVFGQNK